MIKMHQISRLFILSIMILFASVRCFLHGGSMQRSRDMAMMARKKREMPPNPVAVVTGASRGIGKAIALALGTVIGSNGDLIPHLSIHMSL
jgi:hypothetical protein